jgi:L-aspartate semialdehyde sulfurtransferase ferredoxin
MTGCRRVKLTFPPERIREPVIGTLAREFDVMPNIRRAKIGEDAGECVLELDGSEENLDRSIQYLVGLGIVVEPVDGNYLVS